MKYIKEYKDIDWVDFDWDDFDIEEEEDSNVHNITIKYYSQIDWVYVKDNYKVNDNIRITIDESNKKITLKGRIIYLDNQRFTIEFEKNINSHDGLIYGHGKQGHCWIFNKSQQQKTIGWLIDKILDNNLFINENKDIDWDDWDIEEEEPTRTIIIKPHQLFDNNIKKGDKIIVYKGSKPYSILVVDTTLTNIGLEFGFNIRGHDCQGHGKNKYCWYFEKNSLLYDQIMHKIDYHLRNT